MKKSALIASVLVIACACGIGGTALSSALSATADEPVGVAVDGPPEGAAPAGTMMEPSDAFPPLSSFTEQPGEEGFISLDRMRSQCYELMQEYPNLPVSSNPWDYVADEINPYFNDIVALGPIAIPELKRELSESHGDGDAEYLFGIAIERIEEADLKGIVDKKSLPWSGKQFLEVWTSVEEEAPQRISEIVKSNDLALEEKEQMLGAYGALAVPYFMELVGDASIDPELRAFMAEYIEQWDLTDEEIAALLQ